MEHLTEEEKMQEAVIACTEATKACAKVAAARNAEKIAKQKLTAAIERRKLEESKAEPLKRKADKKKEAWVEHRKNRESKEMREEFRAAKKKRGTKMKCNLDGDLKFLCWW